MPGMCGRRRSVPKGRYDSARRDLPPDDSSANHPCSIARITGRTTGPVHTAPYGADPIMDGSLAVNCQATIIESLRDKDVGTQSPAPRPFGTTPIRLNTDTQKPSQFRQTLIPVPG